MDSFYVLPVGSIYARPEEETSGYLDIIQELPVTIKGMISSTETASYIKGLARTYDIPEESQPSIAFAILEVAMGKKIFAQLPAIISTELQLPTDKAQKMSSEIERDIFHPIKKELDSFLQQKVSKNSNTSKSSIVMSRPSAQTRKGATQPQNVLNLKEITARPKQEQLRTRSPQLSLPPQPPSKLPHRLPLPPRPVKPPKPPVSPITPLHFT